MCSGAGVSFLEEEQESQKWLRSPLIRWYLFRHQNELKLQVLPLFSEKNLYQGRLVIFSSIWPNRAMFSQSILAVSIHDVAKLRLLTPRLAQLYLHNQSHNQLHWNCFIFLTLETNLLSQRVDCQRASMIKFRLPWLKNCIRRDFGGAAYRIHFVFCVCFGIIFAVKSEMRRRGLSKQSIPSAP